MLREDGRASGMRRAEDDRAGADGRLEHGRAQGGRAESNPRPVAKFHGRFGGFGAANPAGRAG